MSKRGTTKALSIKHEDSVARAYGGVRSPSSGAAITDAGDVRVEDQDTLFECKYTGSPEKPARSTLVTRMEKIADEAWAESKEPALALRFYMPESPLAGPEGWVDLSVRLLNDDAVRSRLIVEEGGG